MGWICDQKRTPKQDKGGGIIPPPRRLREGFQRLRRGGILPPRRVSVSLSRALKTSGKPAFVWRSNHKKFDRWVLQTYHKYVIIMLYDRRSNSSYGNRTEDQSRQAEIAHEPNGVRPAFRCELRDDQPLGERKDDAQLSRAACFRATL